MGYYTLVGVDGNAYSVMGYVTTALTEMGLGKLSKQYIDEATSSDYNNLLAVSCKYLDKANEVLDENYDGEYEDE